ncbi:MAG: UvrB/UvrC motif-containing protein [Phycisphaerales bacterium]|nr:UvrB/UvrC motif-containing protein [Phycisphaerales bacterium]
MKCDRCDSEATVQDITIRNGVRIERHLCEQCARQAGLGGQTNVPLAELLTKWVVASGIGAPANPSTPAPARQAPVTECPACRMTWNEFRQVDRLGCPDCYSAFEGQLGPLLERAHEGGFRHSGKVPTRAASRRAAQAKEESGGAVERAQRINTLRKQLDQAVLAEQYERAAALRDEIRRLGDPGTPPTVI